MIFKERIIKELELKPVTSLEEIILSKSFFFDTIYNSETEVPIYPVTKNANLTHNLLSLYGTHWRYFLDEEWNLRREDSDTSVVIDNLRVGKKVDHFACYAFTQKFLDAKKSLFIFAPNTPGWSYYRNILLPTYEKDSLDYEEIKEKAKNEEKS